MEIQANELLLERAYYWEKQCAGDVFMTQPLGHGQVREYTWRRTLDEARRMANHLRGMGFEPGSRIGILSKNCAHFVLSDLAIWMAGHVSVALYPTLAADTVSYILKHSECRALFVGKLDGWPEIKPGVPSTLPCIRYSYGPAEPFPEWDDIVRRTPPIEGSPVRAADDLAILVYTSGSTGRPKGVAHNFRGMSAPSKGLVSVLGLQARDRMISYLPLAHVFERAVVEAGGLIHGSQIFFAESLDTFVEDLQRARPTVFHSVPRLWLKFQMGVLAKMPQHKLDKLLGVPLLGRLVKRKILKGLGLDHARLAISGSAPIPAELITWYQKLGLELLEGYGMSENFAYSHVSLPGLSRAGYVGHTAPLCETRLSAEGEILVKSPGNMVGYYKEPEMTAEAFTEDGFLKTGDRGEIDAEGRLRITGRVKELFKTSKGKYIAPAPIENLLNASNLVEQSCVTGSGHPQAHGLLLLSEDARRLAKSDPVRVAQELEQLLLRVNKRVEGFEKLAFLAVVRDDWQIENGFLTPTMKIKRTVIEEAYNPSADAWYAAKEPVVWQSPEAPAGQKTGGAAAPNARLR